MFRRWLLGSFALAFGCFGDPAPSDSATTTEATTSAATSNADDTTSAGPGGATDDSADGRDTGSTTEGPTSGPAGSTTGKAPGETVYLGPLTCGAQAQWSLVMGLEVFGCNQTTNGAEVDVLPSQTVDGNDYLNVVELLIPPSGGIRGEFSGLPLDGFVQPVFRGFFACSSGCSVTLGVEAREEPGRPDPVVQVQGAASMADTLVPIELDLAAVAGGADPSVTLVVEEASGSETLGYWVEARVEDAAM